MILYLLAHLVASVSVKWGTNKITKLGFLVMKIWKITNNPMNDSEHPNDQGKMSDILVTFNFKLLQSFKQYHIIFYFMFAYFCTQSWFLYEDNKVQPVLHCNDVCLCGPFTFEAFMLLGFVVLCVNRMTHVGSKLQNWFLSMDVILHFSHNYLS